MKFTLSWLRDHLETDASVERITHALTMLGLEVERVHDPARVLAPFSVAQVRASDPHPDASRLRVCQVETLAAGGGGDGGPQGARMVQVVCGAPNVRAGMKAVFAPPGVTLPGTGVRLKAARIRGVESNGMLCSERELGLSDDHESIIEAPAGAAVGAGFAAAAGLDDPVIEVAVTPNRPDCLGVRGIARDLAAAGVGRLTPEQMPQVAGAFAAPVRVRLDFAPEEADACAVFAGRTMRGLRNGPSPDWLVRRLQAIGLRSVNALVDVTNYICHDRARPLHVYDASRLTGAVCARLGRKGESFTGLDGKTHAVDPSMCVIADEAQVLGLGGILGGEASSSTLETTEVFVESAWFDPVRTAHTGRRTGIESDARHRFERGVDPASVVPGCDLACAMIRDICGGEAGELEVAGALPGDALSALPAPAPLSFDAAEVARLTGLDVAAGEAAELLRRLGFEVRGEGGVMQVTPPSWRPDVETSACLVEEIIRVRGVDSVPEAPLPRPAAVARPVLTLEQKRLRAARRVLAVRGLVEAVTWSFVPAADAARFAGGAGLLHLANPISTAMAVMRPSLLPGLVAAVGHNADRGLADLALFEVGQQFAGAMPEDQQLAAAGVRHGVAGVSGFGRHWRTAAAQAGVFDAKADLLAVLAAAGTPVGKLRVRGQAPAWYHPGRSGVLELGPNRVLGQFGELHPRLLEAMNISGPVAAFEARLDAVPVSRRGAARALPPLEASDLQPVRRDFAFAVPDAVRADDLLRATAAADKALIAGVRLFDVFRGPGLEDGMKSLAIEVTLQPRRDTLTDEDLAAVTRKITAAVAKATGGRVRG